MVARKGRIVQEINANAAGNEHENLNDETIVLRDDGEAAVLGAKLLRAFVFSHASAD